MKSWVLVACLSPALGYGLDAVPVVVALAAICVTAYALVCRCLRDASPSERPEILRALAEVVRTARLEGRGEPRRPPRSGRPE